MVNDAELGGDVTEDTGCYCFGFNDSRYVDRMNMRGLCIGPVKGDQGAEAFGGKRKL